MDHSIPFGTTGVLAQERYEIAPPAQRHGFCSALYNSAAGRLLMSGLSEVEFPRNKKRRQAERLTPNILLGQTIVFDRGTSLLSPQCIISAYSRWL
jgi:hypothetical protein